MAITFIDAQSTTGSGQASLTVTKPTGTAENDVIVAGASQDSIDTLTLPTTFTSEGSLSPGSQNSGVCGYKVAGASEPANYTFTTHTSEEQAAGLATFRGVKTSGGPLSETTTANESTDTPPAATHPFAPSITLSKSNNMLVAIIAHEDADGSPYTPADNFTEDVDVSVGSGGVGTALVMAHYLRDIGGATGNMTFTSDSAIYDSYAAWTIALGDPDPPPIPIAAQLSISPSSGPTLLESGTHTRTPGAANLTFSFNPPTMSVRQPGVHTPYHLATIQNGGAGVSSVDVDVPGSIAGDVCIALAVVTNGTLANDVIPTGFTSVQSNSTGGNYSGGSHCCYIGYKRLTDADISAGKLTFSNNGNNADMNCVLITWANLDVSAGEDDESAGSQSSSLTVNVSGVTTSVDNCMLMAFGGQSLNGNTPYSSNDSYSEAYDGVEGSTDTPMFAGYKLQATATTIGTTSWTASGTASSYGTRQYSFFPAKVIEIPADDLAFSTTAPSVTQNYLFTVPVIDLGLSSAAPLAGARLYPVSDDSVGEYHGRLGQTTNLFNFIDEDGSLEDAEYISTDANPSAAVYRCNLRSVADPASSTGHTIRYKVTNSIRVGTMAVTVRLKEGATTRATHNPSAMTPGEIRVAEWVLSSGEIDSITNYADLSLEFSFTAVGP